jgi:phosphoribosylaminoimidazolecarboxamide formyltransferase/IMP cyclohydrolase
MADPKEYGPVLEEMRDHGGCVTAQTSLRLAVDAFERTSRYDAAIARYLRDR